MADIYLLRHGEARGDGPDSARTLTESGAAGVERLAAWAARANITVNEIRHSGKRRAEQTAEIMARHLRCAVRQIDGISPNDDPERFAEEIAFEDEPVMIVSHLPFLGNAVAALTRVHMPVADFHPATLVALVRVDERFVIDFVVYPAICDSIRRSGTSQVNATAT